MEDDLFNLKLDMITDNGKAAGNRQKYVNHLEFQPQSYPIFCPNLHWFQAEQPIWVTRCGVYPQNMQNEKGLKAYTVQPDQKQASFR